MARDAANPGLTRSERRNRRIGRGLVLFVVAFTVLYAADASRQPTSGAGWRLLGYQRGVGEANTVRVIADQAELEEAWAKMLLRTTPSKADFGRVAVYWFTNRGTIGCPSRFEGLRIDAGRHLVAGSFSLAVTSGCDSAGVPDSFLVAIDHDRLPTAPYRVQVAEPLPADVPGAFIEVTR